MKEHVSTNDHQHNPSTGRTTEITPSPSGADRLQITVSQFSCGWEHIHLDFNETVISFNASYIGDEPLASLLQAIGELEDACSGDEMTDSTCCWQDEPGRCELQFERHIPTDRLNLKITIDSLGVTPDDTPETWEIHDFSYPEFKRGVIEAAFRMLRTYGLSGYARTWGCPDIFPLETLLRLLHPETVCNKADGSFRSDFVREMELLQSLLK